MLCIGAAVQQVSERLPRASMSGLLDAASGRGGHHQDSMCCIDLGRCREKGTDTKQPAVQHRQGNAQTLITERLRRRSLRRQPWRLIAGTAGRRAFLHPRWLRTGGGYMTRLTVATSVAWKRPRALQWRGLQCHSSLRPHSGSTRHRCRGP